MADLSWKDTPEPKHNERVRRHINFIRASGGLVPPPTPNKKRLFLWLVLGALTIILGALFFVFTQSKNTSLTTGPDIDTIDLPEHLKDDREQGVLARIKHLVLGNNAPALEGVKEDRVNILLLGMGGLGHDGPFLTDTMIIVSIKPSTQQIAMVSIPRDLGVEIPDHGTMKINHANSIAEVKKRGTGGTLASSVVADTFQIPIHYYARIDFFAFEELIDHVGGITIDVERGFTDTQYPAANFLFQTVSFPKGPQLMNGATALKYARSRHGNNGEGSDFARARRQQKMLLALKQKLVAFETLANPVRMANIIKTLDSHFTTDMSWNEMLEFVKEARNLKFDKISNMVLDTSENSFLESGFTNEGAFILRPKSGDFTEIRSAVQSLFTDIPSVADTTPTQAEPGFTPTAIEIWNGTWQAGLAAQTKSKVTDKGLNVTNVSNTQNRPMAESAIYVLGDRPRDDVVAALRDIFGFPVYTTLPAGEVVATSTNIVIILGDNYSP